MVGHFGYTRHLIKGPILINIRYSEGGAYEDTNIIVSTEIITAMLHQTLELPLTTETNLEYICTCW